MNPIINPLNTLRKIRLTRPRGPVVVLGYGAMVVSWGLLLLATQWPDPLLLLLTIPVVWSALFYPRSVYISMMLIAAAASIVVAYRLSSKFSTSLQTITLGMLCLWIMAELIHKLVKDQKQFEEALQQRNRELAALNAVTATITATLEPDQVFQRLVDTVHEVVPQATAATIQLLDERDGILRTKAASAGLIPVSQKVVFRPGEGIAGLALAQRRPINVTDVTSDPRYLPGSTSPAYRSLLAAPLVIGQRVWGTLSLAGEAPGAFQARDERLLASLAQQAAIAIENARLYEETRRRLTETAILQTVSAAAATLDFDQVLYQAIEALHRLLGIERVEILLPDEAGDTLRPRREGSIGFPTSPDGEPMQVPIDRSISGQVYRSGQSVLIADVSTVPNYYAKLDDSRSELCVPLQSGDQVIGVLNAESPRLAAFDENDQRLLEAIGAQLAVALDNARLYEETARRAREQATVASIARALNASLDVVHAFPAVVEGLRALADCERVSLTLPDEERQQFTFVALDSPRPELGQGVTLSYSASAAIPDLLAGRVHLTPDLAAESDYPGERALYQAGFRSRVNLPLISGDQPIGALDLASRRLAAFTQDDLPPLQQIADVLAVAIVNSRLHEETIRRLNEVHALAEASAHLTAELEPKTTFAAVVEQARAVLGADRAAVYLFDQQTERFSFVYALGLSDEYLKDVQQLYRDLPGHRTLSGQPVWVEEAQAKSSAGPLQELARREGYNTLVALPLSHHAEVTGTLVLYFDQHRSHNQALLDLAQAFANQAAVALENARLFDLVRSAETQYRGLFEGSADPIAVMDREGILLDVNPAACRILGQAREELLGRNGWVVSNRPQSSFYKALQQALEGEVFNYEFSASIDDQVRRFEAHLERIDYSGGAAIQWTAHDVTARRELDHWREELTGIIVHNLRNPLTWIKSGIEAARMFLPEDTDPDVTFALDKANKGATRLEQQIDALLNINRAEAGQELTNQEPLLPARLVTDVIELLNPRAAVQGVQLQAELPESMPVVLGNRNMLALTLENLIDNAIKFSPRDEIVTIRACVCVPPALTRPAPPGPKSEHLPLLQERRGAGAEDKADQSMLCISVTDRGLGVPPAERESIFQKFYQVRRSYRTKGSGLGLYFCKLAIEAHGGRIWVENNQEGQGSTFSFTLPL
jgi:NtrC-family two-component system sensor histidine kinase KinB